MVKKITSATLAPEGATTDMFGWWWVLMCFDTSETFFFVCFTINLNKKLNSVELQRR